MPLGNHVIIIYPYTIIIIIIIIIIIVRTLVKGYKAYNTNTVDLHDYNLCNDEVKDSDITSTNTAINISSTITTTAYINNDTVTTKIVYPSSQKMMLFAILVLSTNSINIAIYNLSSSSPSSSVSSSSSLNYFKGCVVVMLTTVFMITTIMITLMIRLILVKENSSRIDDDIAVSNCRMTPYRLTLYPIICIGAGTSTVTVSTMTNDNNNNNNNRYDSRLEWSRRR